MSDVAVLTYWDGRGNAEIIRLMMATAGQEWVERVYKSEEEGVSHMTKTDQVLLMMKDGVLAFDQLPLLQIDGVNIVQKMAAVRHLARKHNMYGANASENTQCDIVAECILDFTASLRHADMAGSLVAALGKCGPRFERMLSSNATASGFFVGASVTFVDIMLFYLLDSGVEIGVSLDAHPGLSAHHARVRALPSLAAYLQSDRHFPSPGLPGYMDRVRATMPWLFGDGAAPAMSSQVWHFQQQK
mmetsp:Transcript_26899/g.45397  ORF Transcript_26899/g.45397 Transcript_26899/m.45397 type:complete len:245 (+) Transcript_26899:51-785(+)|eukprot:CAMPEP_0114429680 /NCGR_PEP_ID=MMETSP0103-20121206/9622_1 /TAXON_ID=37642 ORGANISM="Paraphysomonas imperforata, Strain PA2" /NCGR_SAMPLE_ID=MMETSP0103 /ASSEMBLY_ACC=CAM_ASM_000201 /LENGTH=244 /DNA_ID=CAMNT_0001599047 /DNA_START=40 /DNA_END=774 /DNA_ORIENTATION=-